MIELHTLGDALIKVGDREVRPTSPVLFSALLYLCVERGRRVPRRVLQELLFPEASPRNASHSLRQLLYKMRQLGVPLVDDGASVSLAEEIVCDADDVTQLDVHDDGQLEIIRGGLLPGLNTPVSRVFAGWLEERRTLFRVAARNLLLRALAAVGGPSDSASIQRLSRVLLDLDPLNEEATLALAESLALSGQKYQALRILDDYCSDLGRDDRLTLPPRMLRRRISELTDLASENAPLVGRDRDLAWLLSFAGNHNASLRVVLLWGDQGIGKSRLLQEFVNRMLLRGVAVHTAHCREYDTTRSFAPLSDILPALLQMRGALGASPEALVTLRALAGRTLEQSAPSGNLPILDAYIELLSCLASEAPLVIAIENVQWLDAESLRLVGDSRLHAQRILFILTRRSPATGAPILEVPGTSAVRRLAPLDRTSSGLLFDYLIGGNRAPSTDVRSQCIAISSGNPLFLENLARHLQLGGPTPHAAAELVDILRQRLGALTSTSLLLTRTIAVLAHWASVERVAAVSGLAHSDMLLALQQVADAGLIIHRSATLRCFHDLVSETVAADMPEALLVALQMRAAQILEAEAEREGSRQGYWVAAEYWHRLSSSTNALRCLRLAATLSAAVGDTALASAAYEKAISLATDGDRAALALDALQCADKWGDAEGVIRNAGRVPQSLSASGMAAARIDIAILTARRRLGNTLWDDRHRLRTLALDDSAEVEVRERAARIYFLVAEQELAGSEALAFRSDLRASTLGTTKAWSALEMVYQMAFGSLETAVALGADALDSVGNSSGWPRLRILLDLGIASFRSGKVKLATGMFEEAASLAVDLGTVRPLVLSRTTMAAVSHALGDAEAFREHHLAASDLIRKHQQRAPAIHLANCVDFALLNNDDEAANEHLNQLSQIPESQAPYHRRMVLAYSVLLSCRAGVRPSDQVLEELPTLHERGRMFCDHDAFAFACALIGENTAFGLSRHDLADYAARWRRERYEIPRYLRNAISGEKALVPAFLS